MSGDIVLGIRLKYDGKDVTGGVAVSRDQFRQLATEARRAGEATAGGFTSAARGVRSISDQLDAAKKAALGYFSVTQLAGGARWVLDQATAMQQLDARIRVATASAHGHRQAVAGVFEIANRWGAAVGQTAGAYARLNPVIAQLGGDSAVTLRMLDGLAASLRLSGATAGETNAVLLQFAQAMGSGRVSGDEFRSLMESAEPLMRAVAGQLGKTTGELRQMAEDGKLTSSVFGNALLPAIDQLKAKAEQIPLGLSQAWQVLENNLARDFGREFADGAGLASQAIKSLSGHTMELAAGVHAASDGILALIQAGTVAGAGAGGAWLAKQALAARESATAILAARAARIAEAEAAVTSAASKAAAATAALPALLAEKAALDQMMIVGPQRARVEREIAAAKAASTLASNALAGAEAQLATARGAATLAASAGRTATLAARGAVAALGGPLGVALTLLSAGATAWALWGNSADDAARKGETAADRVRRKLEETQKQNRFGAGDIGQARQDLAAAREEQARVQALFDGMPTVYRTAKFNADNAVREAETLVAALERQQAAAGGYVGQRLSAAGEYTKLTTDLKWREKLVADHQERLLALQTAYADKMAAATEKERPGLLRNHQAALRAELERQRQELDALPEAKEGKALAEAAAEARVKSAQAASKRVLEVLKHENEQYRLAAGDMLRAAGAVKANAIDVEIVALQDRLAAATRESERLPIRARIRDLRAELAAIPAEVARGMAEIMSKARTVGENASAEWALADAKALAGAAAWRRENLSLLDQELAAAREKSAADLRERLAQLDKNEALRQAPELLARYRDAAERQAAATLAGIEAEIRARDAANASWQAGARQAFLEYERGAADAAGNTRRVFVDGYRRMEDAAVQFMRTGKLSIRDLADYAISEFYRISVAQPFVKGLAGFAGNLNFDGLWSSAKVAMSGVQPFDYSSYYSQAAFIDPSAKGNAFERGGKLHYFAKGAAFSNGVVTTPTYFSFGGGRLGQMAENEPEAVMPLKRGRDGRLGVEVAGGAAGTAGGGVVLHFAPTYQIDARGAGAGVGPMLEKVVDAAVARSRTELLAELDGGGRFAYATGRRRA